VNSCNKHCLLFRPGVRGGAVNADKTSMVVFSLFTNYKKLVGFTNPILFGTELQLKNQVKYLELS
jgi:hypothetical protein